MPFGAQIEDGATRFRLWAPAAGQVDVELDGKRMPLARGDGGWHESRIAGAGAGARYHFVIDGDLRVPDPASRFNPDDIHGASEVIDPLAFDWRDDVWRGRRWEEAVIYELHIGCFSRSGDYDGLRRRLDYLACLLYTSDAADE